MNSANKIYAEISVGELLDKISILEIKQKNLKDNEKIKIVNKELESLNMTLKKDVTMTEEIQSLYQYLKKINSMLWVYIENDNRAKIKNKINQLSGSNISEVKSYEKY